MSENTTTTPATPARLLKTAVDRSFIAARAEVAVAETIAQSVVSFSSSAAAFATAGDNGITDVQIADAIVEKALADGLLTKNDKGKIVKPDNGVGSLLYTSPTAVGYHRKTGVFLGLEGDMPEGVEHPNQVQSLIKRVPSRKVKGAPEIETLDVILSTSADKAEAFARMERAASAKDLHARREAEGDEGGEGAEGKAPKTVADYVAAMTGPFQKIEKSDLSDDTFFTPEGLEAFDAFVSQVVRFQAGIAAKQAEDAAVATANARP